MGKLHFSNLVNLDLSSVLFKEKLHVLAWALRADFLWIFMKPKLDNLTVFKAISNKNNLYFSTVLIID